MKEKTIIQRKKLFRRISSAFVLWMVYPAIFISFLSDKTCSNVFFSDFFIAQGADANEKQKADIESLFKKLQNSLAERKLRNVRSTVELIDFKIDKIKKGVSGEEISSYNSRIDNIKKWADALEDTLINEAYKILRAQGPDSALFYTANELRVCGVSENKIRVAEKKILKEGPKIKRAKEQEAIAKTVKLLERGQKPDPSIDRITLQSAQRIVKRRADSINAINEGDQKELKEQKRQEKARLEREKKERKLEGERLAALKKEEEERQREYEKAEKRLLTEKDSRQKLQAKQEKARSDSIEAQRKARRDLTRHQEELSKMMEEELNEKQRQLQLEEERKNKLIAKQQAEQQEMARRDSIEAYRKEQEVLKQQEKEQRAQMARREKELAYNKEAMPSGTTQSETSEAQRWEIGMAGQNEQVEDWREKERQENQRLAEAERKQRENLARLAERRQETIPQIVRIPTTMKPNMEQDEIQRLLDNVRREKERLTRLEQQLQQQIIEKQGWVRQNGIEDASKLHQGDQVTRIMPKTDPEAIRLIRQNDEERRRQLLALQEKARIDYQKKLDEEKAKLKKNSRQMAHSGQESVRKDYTSGKKGVISVDVDKDLVKYDEVPPESRQTSLYFKAREEAVQSNDQRSDYEKSIERQKREEAARENEWKVKEKRRRAEKFITKIYNYLEKNDVKKARKTFNANQDYISQYGDIEAFNVLEKSIISAETDAASTLSTMRTSARRGSGYSETPKTYGTQPQVQYSSTPKEKVKKAEPAVAEEVNWEVNELEYISRINGFIRDGNGKAAYKEFRKVEEQLKNYFTVEEFNHFKAMVENAYKSKE